MCFALSTVFTKFVTNSSDIKGVEITFARFFIGFIVVALYVYHEKIPLKPYRISLIIWRGVLNTVAFMLFFTSLQYTTVTNANMLNMTYPVFIVPVMS